MYLLSICALVPARAEQRNAERNEDKYINFGSFDPWWNILSTLLIDRAFCVVHVVRAAI